MYAMQNALLSESCQYFFARKLNIFRIKDIFVNVFLLIHSK